jgi:hypothetical protein
VDEALNYFRVKSEIIEDWKRFQTVMTGFYRHVENVILWTASFYSLDTDID